MTDVTRKVFSAGTVIDALIAVPLGIVFYFVGLVLLTYFISPQEPDAMASESLVEYIYLPILYFLIALHVGYLGAVIIGVPLHFMLVKSNFDNLVGYIFAGFLASIIVVSIWLGPIYFTDAKVHGEEVKGLFIVYGVPPFVIAVVFGLLRQHRHRTKQAAT